MRDFYHHNIRVRQPRLHLPQINPANWAARREERLMSLRSEAWESDNGIVHLDRADRGIVMTLSKSRNSFTTSLPYEEAVSMAHRILDWANQAPEETPDVTAE